MKRAFLIGINYIGQPGQLNGCINDMHNMYNYLSTIRKYNQFIFLNDHSNIKPTKNNILLGISVFLTKIKRGDELWFHFSGHGSLSKDLNGDEESGQDSCIVPIDYMLSGFIIDDELRNNLINRVPSGVTLYIVLDACHSGTGCDLRYKIEDESYLLKNKTLADVISYIPDDWALKQTFYEFKKYSKTNSNIFLISGCGDMQTSADAYIGTSYSGALTYYLCELLRKNRNNYKWKHLLKDLVCTLKIKGFTQIPVLTSGLPLNTETII